MILGFDENDILTLFNFGGHETPRLQKKKANLTLICNNFSYFHTIYILWHLFESPETILTECHDVYSLMKRYEKTLKYMYPSSIPLYLCYPHVMQMYIYLLMYIILADIKFSLKCQTGNITKI